MTGTEESEAYRLIDERLSAVREKLARAEGASPYHQKVTLMAVTKTIDADRINHVLDCCGITDIGENRPQELCEKYPLLHLDGVRVHQIGTLQSNKVKYIIDKTAMIHSLDSQNLAQEIEKQAAKHALLADCLIEINIGREENKGGILPDEDALFRFYESAAVLPHVRVRGVMTIAPNTHDRDAYLRYFSETRRLYEALRARYLDNALPAGCAPVLSMGMSGSFEEAVLCGADIVRVGSAIFGERTYPAAKTVV